MAAADGDYVCTLTNASVKRAREELNEIPSDRLSSVQAFRSWILDQKYIKCPTDTKFLLAFLRARKFSQLEARNLLERFLTRRKALAYMFHDLDPTSADTQMMLDKQIILSLPGTDKEGRKIMLARPGTLEPSFLKKHKHTLFKMMATVLDYVHLDENTQVNGLMMIMDVTNFSMSHHSAIPIAERKEFLGVWQKGYPSRIKGMHLYNMGALMDFLMGVVKMIMTEKIQKRLHTHHDLESLYKHVPMEMLPEEYLPDDYEGKHAGSFHDITENMKKEMGKPEVVARIKVISSSKNLINESLKPTEVVQQSFRKLNVD